MNAQLLLIGNDQTIRVSSLQDEISGAYINDAVVTVTIKTKTGIAVSGQSWPTTLDYVAASDGNYRGNLEDSIDLMPHSSYSIEIVAVSGSGRGFWKFTRQAVHRTP